MEFVIKWIQICLEWNGRTLVEEKSVGQTVISESSWGAQAFTIRLQYAPAVYKGLVTTYGEEGRATKWEGGARKVLPLWKGGGGKSFSHAEGGHKRFWGSFLSGSLKF